MGWRNWFRRTRRSPSTSSNAIGMVMLHSETFQSVPALAYLRDHWQDLPSIANVATEGPTTVGVIPGGALGFVHIPAPIPASDLDGPIKLAWHWPEAATLVPTHQSHVIVHAGSTTLGPLECHLLLTKTIASILACSRGLGVYIGEALLVLPAEEYLAQAGVASRDALPIPLWIGLHPVNDPPGLSAYTTGLTSFGLLELEVHHSRLAAPELLGRMADLAHYQLGSGNVLKDGDTFGESEFDRARIRHVPSEFIPDTRVALLEL
jgi:Domain of unknown function (DUF4261)